MQVGSESYLTVNTDFFPPGNFYLAKMDVKKNGSLAVKSLQTVDFSKWGGLWVACSGDLVQHRGKTMVLGSEEYEPNGERIVWIEGYGSITSAYLNIATNPRC